MFNFSLVPAHYYPVPSRSASLFRIDNIQLLLLLEAKYFPFICSSINLSYIGECNSRNAAKISSKSLISERSNNCFYVATNICQINKSSYQICHKTLNIGFWQSFLWSLELQTIHQFLQSWRKPLNAIVSKSPG